MQEVKHLTTPFKPGLARKVLKLASRGFTPKEIEELLGFAPYTIHHNYHHCLMLGYKRYAENDGGF